MNHSQILLLPNPRAAESVRGYMLRTAAENLLPRMFSEEIKTLVRTNRFISRIAKRDFSIAERLVTRFAPSDSGLTSKPQMTMLGADIVPMDCLHVATRQVCPLCLAESSYSRLEWEIKSIRACPAHQVSLINVCPNCDKPLQWHRSSLMNCFCGQQLHFIDPVDATPWQVTWAKQIKSAAFVSRLSLQPSSLACMKMIPVRLSKLLLMADVVRRVLLPEHIPGNLNSEMAWQLTTKILSDKPYSAYLWDAIFIYASGDPFQMSDLLTPGRKTETVIAAYKDLLPELALPHSLRVLTSSRRKLVKPLKVGPPFDVRIHGIGPYRFVHQWAVGVDAKFGVDIDQEEVDEVSQ